MLVTPGAIEPIPAFAIVDDSALRTVLQRVTRGESMRRELDAAFRQLETRQPALAELMAGELAELDGPAEQAIGYFLFLTIYMTFEQAFGARLGTVTHTQLDATFERLLTDSEVREGCVWGTCTEDAVALGQPALMGLVDRELERAGNIEALHPMVEALLVEVVSLSHSVAPTS